MKTALAALLAATLLAACGEKAPRSDPEKQPTYNGVDAPGQLAERMRNQGESRRIGY
jgi:hypothetical protein